MTRPITLVCDECARMARSLAARAVGSSGNCSHRMPKPRGAIVWESLWPIGPRLRPAAPAMHDPEANLVQLLTRAHGAPRENSGATMIRMCVLRAGCQHQRGLHAVEHTLEIAFEILAVIRRPGIHGILVHHSIRTRELRPPWRVRVVMIQEKREHTAVRVAEKVERLRHLPAELTRRLVLQRPGATRDPDTYRPVVAVCAPQQRRSI